MPTRKPRKAESVAQLNQEVDDLDLSALSPEELETVSRVIHGNSAEAQSLRRSRKDVRYKLYRLRSEAEGKSSIPELDETFRKSFSSQPAFRGWKFFAVLWDVDLVDPLVVVARDHSEQADWDNLVASRLPQIHPGGGLHYPDLTVRKKVVAHARSTRKKTEPSGS